MTGLKSWIRKDITGQADNFNLEFEKVFDTYPSGTTKMQTGYDIGGKTLKLIDSFLCLRQQRVAVNGV